FATAGSTRGFVISKRIAHALGDLRRAARETVDGRCARGHRQARSLRPVLRTDSRLLIDRIIHEFAPAGSHAPDVVVDLGCGTGAFVRAYDQPPKIAALPAPTKSQQQ